MSKSHAASRRRSYGRRQHDVAERRFRDIASARPDAAGDALGLQTAPDGRAMADANAARGLYAMGA